MAQPRTGAPERRGRNKGALAALERSNEVLSAIAGAQGRFIESGASPDALDALLRLVLRTSGCSGGLIAEALDSAAPPAPAGEAEKAAGEARVLVQLGWDGTLAAGPQAELFARVLETGRPAAVAGRASALPLEHGEQVVGLLALACADSEPVDEALSGALQPVVATIATLIEAGRAYRLREHAELRHREALERALRADADLRLRNAALEAAANAMVLCDRDARILWVNPAFTALTGWTAEEAVGRTPRILSSNQHDAAFYARMWGTIQRGEVWRGDIHNRRKDGSLYHEEMTIAPIRGEQQAVTHFVAIKQSLDWRDAAEKQLRESERRFRRLVQGVEAIVWEADARTGRLSFVNERAERILGYPISEWLVETDFRVERTHPDDRAAVRRVLQSMPAGVRHHDFRMIAADGREVWFHEIVRLEAAAHGERLTGVMIDVSHARQLEKAVRAAAEEWVATFDAMESAIFLLDSAGMVKRLNQAAARLAGGSWRDCIGEQLSVFGDSEPWCAAVELARAAAAQRSVQERQVVDADAHWWHVEASARRRVLGREQHVIVTVRDVTQVVELQNSVKRAQTMATVGSVVAGVAHEVRNPLFAMSVNIDVLAAELGEQPEVREVIDALRVERDRISRLMQDLLDFGRPASGVSRLASLDAILERAAARAEPVASALGVDLRPAPPSGVDLDCHPERLEQVFQNLVENACQHAPAGSAVSVEARERGERVQVRIRDRGRGFAEEALPRVFEPFFTRRKGGTGLGLAIVHKIVDEHGGRVTAENHAGGGAEVTVELPLRRREG